jgi:O-antigen/teichoic acid export membrane protein
MKKTLQRLFNSTMVRNTLWMSGGQGLRLLIQAAFFTVIARSLGVDNYGSFVGVVALVGILCPFGALGSGNLLVKRVALDKGAFPEAWGGALITTACCGAILIATVLLLAHFMLPAIIPLRLVLLVAVADILGLSVITIAAQAFQSFDQLKWSAAINVFLNASRLMGAIGLVLVHHHPSALQWGYVYFVCSSLAAILSSCLVFAKLGAPKFVLRRSLAEYREGFYFSVGLSAQTIYNDIDKTMLVRLSTLDATGIYGAGYRLIDVSFAPVLALLYAAYPNFFRKGSTGIASSFSYAKPLLLRTIVYALIIGIGILLFAGIVPYVLGSEYARTTEVLRWLSPLPVLKSIHYFLSDSLTGAGHQGLRSGLQTGVAIFNVLINFWLIPAYSWRGAAWSSIASDALLACAAGTAVYILSKRSQRLVTTQE